MDPNAPQNPPNPVSNGNPGPRSATPGGGLTNGARLTSDVAGPRIGGLVNGNRTFVLDDLDGGTDSEEDQYAVHLPVSAASSSGAAVTNGNPASVPGTALQPLTNGNTPYQSHHGVVYARTRRGAFSFVASSAPPAPSPNPTVLTYGTTHNSQILPTNGVRAAANGERA